MSTRTRKGLTPARILDEAFELADSGGPRALTMRSLAKRLDVAPMAIYNHFHDRDAILDALAERVFTQWSAAMRSSNNGLRQRSWKAQLRAVMKGARDLAVLHPHIYRAAMSRPKKPAAALLLRQETLDTLRKAGLSARRAETAYQTFVLVLYGYPFWREGSQRNGCLDSIDEEFTRVTEWLLAAAK